MRYVTNIQKTGRILSCWNNGLSVEEAISYIVERKYLQVPESEVRQAYRYLHKNHGIASVIPLQLPWG